ncbi:RICIN domain-containing protein [Streptomyces sp. NPDC015127]|uniref:RICIN domain-containing protein n=1 Tax=Streptomyces sp. NPDC015127 TaxID=3364939 RepID=UPI0036F87825
MRLREQNPKETFMAKNTVRRTARAAAILGTALASALWGFTGPAQAAEVLDGVHYLIKPDHARGTMCLDVANQSTALGADVIQATCWNGWNQQWRIERVAGDYFVIRARHSGKCLDVAYASYSHGADVIQADCRGTTNQQWRFMVETNGYAQVVPGGKPQVGQLVQIRPRHSNKCLDVADLSIAHGANVLQGTCWNGPNQLWHFQVPR